MPTNTQQLAQNKERIISFIKLNGPTLPTKVAKAIQTPPLFASAFLAELRAEKRLKTSNLKVGNSPLYFLPEQEHQLEKFSIHLSEKEKEAFQLLKQNQILDDESLQPAIRVAMRSIKDFAIPLRIRVKEEIKTFWKYFTISNQDVAKLLTKPARKPKAHHPTPTPLSLSKQPVTTSSFTSPITTSPTSSGRVGGLKPSPTPKPKPTSDFAESVKKYIIEKNIEILEVISAKKKELNAKIRIDTIFGKQDFYLVAKDKKTITDNDLTIALQKAQTEKMPAFIMSAGELNKKAIEYITDWKNLIKFEKFPD